MIGFYIYCAFVLTGLAVIGYCFIGCGKAFDDRWKAEESAFDDYMKKQIQHRIHHG